jgi:hypothetical protein
MGVQPGNPVVGGTVLRIPAIQSPNYVPGVSGWIIKIDGSAEFNNLTIRGTFSGTDFIINTAGIFFYNGTPANGNLVLSVSAMAGTDAFGNAYPAGISVVASIQTMPAMENGWSVAGHAKYILDPVGNLVVSWKDLQVGTSADGTEIWAAGSLPAGFQPANNRRLVCYANPLAVFGAEGSETVGCPALELEPDGSVQCFGMTAANRVDLYAVIPLGF